MENLGPVRKGLDYGSSTIPEISSNSMMVSAVVWFCRMAASSSSMKLRIAVACLLLAKDHEFPQMLGASITNSSFQPKRE